MGRETSIEWTNHSFNPWWGCERVSPACAHCYAATFAKRTGHADTWSNQGSDHEFRFFADKHWDEPRRWNDRAEQDNVRRRVFCASMADVFEEHPRLEEPRLRLFALIEETPMLDWQLLTKRPVAMRDFFNGRRATPDEVDDGYELGIVPGYYYDRYDAPLANVWVGTSIENSRWTWRADVLREIPAVVHFISAEPLLGSLFQVSRAEPPRSTGSADDSGPPVAEGRAVPGVGTPRSRHDGRTRQGSRPLDAPERRAQTRGARAPLDLTDIEWVIVGGESGPGHRPMNLDHARELRDACIVGCNDCAALTAEWMPEAHEGPGFEDGHTHWSPCRRPAFFFKQHGGPTPKAGGKLLDGREWCEFPEPDLIPA